MAEKKDQLKNVAFGGNWSEQLVDIDRLKRMLSVIERAARDMRALSEPNPGLRHMEANRLARIIRRSIGH